MEPDKQLYTIKEHSLEDMTSDIPMGQRQKGKLPNKRNIIGSRKGARSKYHSNLYLEYKSIDQRYTAYVYIYYLYSFTLEILTKNIN